MTESERKHSPYSKLGITQEHIDKAHNHADPFTDDAESMLPYVRGTMMRFHREQPQLYDYIRDQRAGIIIYDNLTFGMAAALTYDMMPENHRQQTLSEEEIEVAHQSVQEYREGEENPTIDLTWYINKLRLDAPEFSDWLSDIVTGLDEQESKSDFIFGVALVSLPFYMRAEAKALENTFHNS